MDFNQELRQIPFARIIIPLIFGIIYEIFFPLNFPFTYILYSAIFAIIILLNSIKLISISYKYRWIFGLSVNIIIFIFGIELVSLQWKSNKLSSLTKHEGMIIGNVVQSAVEGNKTIKAIINITAIKNNKQWNSTNGNTIVYFQKDSLSKKIEIGDQIIFDPVLDEINNPKNPNEFDYKKYLSFHLITKQAFIKSNKWKLIKKDEGNFLKILAYKSRNYLLNIYSKYGLKDDEFAVASALTVGYVDKLDAEIKHAYSSSGAMHVLSVSGLHVGIIFVVLNYILFFLDKFKAGRIIKAILIITFIWAYSLLAGMVPAIMRAALMISFVVIGKSLKRNANIYNSILASAFILLIYNPFYIMDIGFQLSYMAVLGIVFYQKKIYNWLYFKNYFLNKTWELFAVSIAAQLVTFPISLYYFHQFPNYFLLTNILVIPLSTIILYLGIFLFAFSYFQIIAAYIAKLLSLTTKALNFFVLYIENLPYSLTENISITVWETFILYFLIILITSYLLYKNVRYLQLSLISIILLLCLNINHKFNTITQKIFVVYNINGNSAYNFITGTDNILFSDVSKENKESKLEKQIKGNWLNLGLENEKFIDLHKFNNKYLFSNILTTDNKNLFYKNNYIAFYNKKIIVIRDEDLKNYKTNNKCSIDYIILGNNNKMTIEELNSLFNVKQIIIDSSNSKYKIDKWSNDCKKLSLKCWSVTNDGAFISYI